MVPITYHAFWDLPRYIELQYRGQVLLMRSDFSEELDDYDPDFEVYVWMPQVSGEERQAALIGRVPVMNVQFDETKRKFLDASILDELLDAYEKSLKLN